MTVQFHQSRFDDVPATELHRLYGLTNNRARGDLRDGGDDEAGSLFYIWLDDRLCGYPFPNTWVILASVHGTYVAWCTVSLLPKEPGHAAVGFYVDPTQRRRGLGHELVRRSRELASCQGAERLLANPWNRASDRFFQSQGFVTVKRYVSGGAHGVAVQELSERITHRACHHQEHTPAH